MIYQDAMDSAMQQVRSDGEPHWMSGDESRRIKTIKIRIHDLHAQRKGTMH